MKRIVCFTLVVALRAISSHVAEAQVANALTVSACNAQSLAAGGFYPQTQDLKGNHCTSSSGGSAPTPYNFTAVSGQQWQLTVASATSLTVPASATMAFISVENNGTYSSAVTWTDDGSTAPTSTKGHYLGAGGGTWFQIGNGGLSNLQFIQTAASGAIDVSYYK